MKNLHVILIAALFSVSGSLSAQSVTGPPGPAPTTPLDGGAIIMPPESEIGLPDTPAQSKEFGNNEDSAGSPGRKNADTPAPRTNSVVIPSSGDDAVTVEIPAGAGQKPARKNFEKNESKKAGCEGPKDLCRQSSAQ